MTSNRFDDHDLMAHADGEADEVTARRIEDAMASDPELAARFRMFVESRKLVNAAYPDTPADTASDPLAASIRTLASAHESAKVVSLADRRAGAGRGFLPTAIAASLTLAAGIGTGFVLGSGPAQQGNADLAALDAPEFATALSHAPSGEELALPDGGTIRAVATFWDEAGTLCREMEHDRADGSGVVAVACRADDEWSLRLAIATGPAAGYAPASSLETLDAWLTSTGAGAPLSAEEETAALATLRQD